MSYASAPPPIFVPYDPAEQKITKKRAPNVSETDFENAFRANVKNTNFALELFKFVSPSEIAWWTNDPSKKTNYGFQGPLNNNYAWWTKAQRWYIDPVALQKKYDPEIKTMNFSDKNVIASLDSVSTPPNTWLSDKNAWHSPATFTGDGLHPANQASWFGTTHRGSAFIYGGTGSGDMSGCLYNINPFAGVAGGYDNKNPNSIYNNYNTWNHFQISEGNKYAWDYDISKGYQSAFAFDNCNDWNHMNNDILANISQQAIYMKDHHFGYTTNGFHDWGTNLFNSKTKWTKDNGDSKLADAFGSICSDPYTDKKLNYKSTQAPSYFEIVDSGAWSQWTKDYSYGNWDNQPVLNASNLDNEKFYYFCKSMLESKRRGYNAYANMLGKIKDLSYAEGPNLQNKQNPDLSVSDWQKIIYGNTETGDPGLAKQCESIKDWYNNVVAKQPEKNSFMNFTFFLIGHGFFNQLEKFYSIDDYKANGHDGIYQVTDYGDHGPIATFRPVAIAGAFQYLMDDNNKLNGITALNSQLKQTTLAAGLIKETEDKDKNKVLSGDADILKILNHDYKYYEFDDAMGIHVKAQLDATNFLQVYKNLLGVYNDCEAKIQALKGQPGKTEVSKSLLTILNAVAPVCELFHHNKDFDSDVDTFKMPVFNFSTYKKDNLNYDDMDWDYLAHENLIYNTNTKSRCWDGYAQIRGEGVSWIGNSARARREGTMSLAKFNPVQDSEAIKKVWVNGSGFDNTSVYKAGSSGIVLSSEPNALLDPTVRNKFYMNADGVAKYGVPAAAASAVRGADLEVNQNPAFAAGSYAYTPRVVLPNENLQIFMFNMLNRNNYNRDKYRYQEYQEQKEQQDADDQKAADQAQARQAAEEKAAEAKAAARAKQANKSK